MSSLTTDRIRDHATRLGLTHLTDVVTQLVDRAEAGAASGVVSTVQRVGSAVGIAIIGSVLFGSLVITGPDTVASGFTTAAGNAMAVSAAFSVVALLLVFALPKRTGEHGPAAPKRAAVAQDVAQPTA